MTSSIFDSLLLVWSNPIKIWFIRGVQMILLKCYMSKVELTEYIITSTTSLVFLILLESNILNSKISRTLCEVKTVYIQHTFFMYFLSLSLWLNQKFRLNEKLADIEKYLLRVPRSGLHRNTIYLESSDASKSVT